MLKNLTNHTIISLSAAIVAICALFVSVWEGVENRNHNRLSVFPKITVWHKAHWQDPEKGIGIWLRNDGVGPAIITDFQVYVDGEKVSSDDTFGGLKNAAGMLGINRTTTNFRYLASGDSVRTAYEAPIFWYESTTPSTGVAYEFSEITYSRMAIIYKYESVYGEEFEVKYNANE